MTFYFELLTKNMIEKSEVVFEVLAEGGSLRISRIVRNGSTVFITKHQEEDFSDEGLDISKKLESYSFPEAFQHISKYPWHMLYLEIVHEDYREFVLYQLIEKLNEDHISQKHFYSKQKMFEDQLSTTIYQNQSGKWCYDDTEPLA